MSRSSVCWKEAVPLTTKFLSTVKSLPIVTSSGKPIVKVVPADVVSISFVVPPTVKSWFKILIDIPVPSEPETPNSVTKPVNCEPSPIKDPVNEPVNFEEAPVKLIEEAPDITLPLSVIEESTNASPLHLVIILVLNEAAPETAIFAVAEPS